MLTCVIYRPTIILRLEGSVNAVIQVHYISGFIEVISVALVQEHPTKELGAGRFAPSFLHVSVVMELFV